MIAGSTRHLRQIGRFAGPRRGVAAICLALTFTGILVLAVTTFLMVTAVRMKQSKYERDVIQALYAAEAGVEYALAALADGAELQGLLAGQMDDANWKVSVDRADGIVQLQSTGTVEPKIGRSVARRVVVRARPIGRGYRISDWKLVPFSPEKESRQRRPAIPEQNGRG